MSDTLTKETRVTTLDDLRAAIDRVVAYQKAPLSIQLANAIGFCAAERDAWRTAFYWFNAHMARPDEGPEKDAGYFAEFDEGMRLIRETFR